MELFTTAEAAAYLRLKERKIYEMVAEGAVPCTKVTGRWLFPKAELDHWLASSVNRPAGMTRREAAPIVGGSHDPLLEWALRESGSGLATLAVGSEAGLDRFLAGETLAAGIHLHALEDPEADANLVAMKGRGDVQDAVMIGFCRREQGLLLAPGNPLKLGSIEDVLRKARAHGAAAEGRRRAAPAAGAAAPGQGARSVNSSPWRRSARPAPTSRRRSAPAGPMPASPPARWPMPPASISSPSSGSRSTW